ncbi:hypothetical protein GOQ29_08830 [Clostridium sp. D2Q-14]|uniref:hypothetical protein n=1 Tax=Anaeromonas gelatinilytica TaxID=2683194 RepID=UPI00193AFF0F|nr:hypothetical protein [Anaeromonas gelatinilytica]MBS4535718.1 hypothetical protein [Anaeromonas gelatinilytica]
MLSDKFNKEYLLGEFFKLMFIDLLYLREVKCAKSRKLDLTIYGVYINDTGINIYAQEIIKVLKESPDFV